jgi:hypothetical protein
MESETRKYILGGSVGYGTGMRVGERIGDLSLGRLTNTDVSKQDWVWVGLVLFSEGTCVMVRCVVSLSLSRKGRCLICDGVTSSSVFDRVIKIQVQVVLQ